MVKGPVGPTGEGFGRVWAGFPATGLAAGTTLLTQMFATPAVRSVYYLRYIPKRGILP